MLPLVSRPTSFQCIFLCCCSFVDRFSKANSSNHIYFSAAKKGRRLHCPRPCVQNSFRYAGSESILYGREDITIPLKTETDSTRMQNFILPRDSFQNVSAHADHCHCTIISKTWQYIIYAYHTIYYGVKLRVIWYTIIK